MANLNVLSERYATAEALRMRKEGSTENRVAELIASDPIFSNIGINREDIQIILTDRAHFVGNARNQIDEVAAKAQEFTSKYLLESTYEPSGIL